MFTQPLAAVSLPARIGLAMVFLGCIIIGALAFQGRARMARAAELLANGDFDKWPLSPEWVIQGASADPAPGGGALLTAASKQIILFQAPIEGVGGADYEGEIEVALASEGSANATLTLRFYDKDLHELSHTSSATIVLTTSPKILQVDSFAPPGAAHLRFELISFVLRPGVVIHVTGASLDGPLPPTATPTPTATLAPATPTATSGTATQTPATPTATSGTATQTPATVTPTASPVPGTPTSVPSPSTATTEPLPGTPTATPTTPVSPTVTSTPTPTTVAGKCAGPDLPGLFVACGRYAVDHPRAVRVGATAAIHLTISVGDPNAQVSSFPVVVRAATPGPDDVVRLSLADEVGVYREMTVRLVAPGLDVQDPEQTLSLGLDARTVTWLVTPQGGTTGQRLALIQVYVETVNIVQFDLLLDVQPAPRSLIDRLNSFVNDARVTLTGLASLAAMAVAGYWWLRRRGWRSPPKS